MATEPLSPKKQNAYEFLVATFTQYGLGSLAPRILQLLQEGNNGAVISLKLQETKEYQQRFAGNELRKKNGLPVLSPAEYLANEAEYANRLQKYGLPVGFYDDPSDFANFIGKNISPNEVEARAGMAFDKARNADPATTQALRELYGLGDGDITAFFLDPDRATAILEKQNRAMDIGAAAFRSGVNTNRATAEDLSGFGVTAEQAQAGYREIGQSQADAFKLASMDNVDLTIGDLEADVFKNDAQAAAKTKGLASRERARFSGKSALNKTSLGTGGSY